MTIAEYEITRVSRKDKSVIDNLLQLHMHDLSQYNSLDCDIHGRFYYPYLDNYWTEENRHVFLIRSQQQIVGFAMVNKHCIMNNCQWHLAEFFIMRHYRRLGIGKQTASEIFDMFKGNWEITILEHNSIAKSFWQLVAKEYTSDNYQYIPNGCAKWHGPVLMFSNE